MVENSGYSSFLKELRRDEEELHEVEKKVHVEFSILIVITTLLTVGVLLLGYELLFNEESVATVKNSTSETIPPTPIVSLSETSKTSSPSPTLYPTQTATKKDYYINLGSGSNKSNDWTDVQGAISTVDIGQYANIKEVSFEASINVPTANGTVSVRAYNDTDKHPVWNSEVTRNGTTDTYLFISPALIYDTGPKLYKVQMKSQLNVSTNLVHSRFHIVTK